MGESKALHGLMAGRCGSLLGALKRGAGQVRGSALVDCNMKQLV